MPNYRLDDHGNPELDITGKPVETNPATNKPAAKKKSIPKKVAPKTTPQPKGSK